MNRSRRLFLEYGFAVLATLAVVLFKLAAGPLLGRESPFLFFLLAPLLSAWRGGLGPGLAATFLSAVAAAYFFAGAASSFGIGTAAWLRVGAFVAEGAIISAIAAARDRAQRGLAAANQRPREILESITDAFVTLNSAFHLTYVNSAAEAALGMPASDLTGKPVWTLFPFLTGTEVEEAARRAMAERTSVHLEYFHEPLARWVEIRAFPGKDGGLSVHFRDVTKRHEGEEQLEQLAAIVEFSDDAIISSSLAGEILTWNQGAQRIYGYTAAEMIGRNLSALLPPDRSGEIASLLERVARGEPVDHWESLRRRKDGGIIPVSVTISPIRDQTGKIRAASNIARDISERKSQEAAMRQWEYVFQNAGWGVVLTDPSGTAMESVNPAFAAMHGYERGELQGRPLSEMLAPEARPEVSKHAAIANERRHAIYEATHLRKDGSRFPVLTDETAFKDQGGQILFRAYYFQDVSERRRLEAKMRESQKLESLGILAGGLAHDFNNLLTGIMGNAGLVLEWLPSDSPARPALTNVIRASERAADLTRQMLAYSGKGRFVIEKVNLSDLIRGTTELIRASVPRKIRLELRLEDDLPPVEADPGQMQQLLMNLVSNGAEAVGEKAGEVSISTGVQDISPEALQGYLAADNAEPGRYVYLEVRDTGSGMDKSTKARIFDPFFTTKFTGRGLGLAAVSGIVRSHNGAMQVESAPGAGTTFRVLLPAVAVAAEGRTTAAVPASNGSKAPTILVVDDEEVVRRAAQAALERCGYPVALASDGAEAVEVFSRLRERIGLVLLDMTMPVMSGEEVFERLRVLDPDLKVIVSSGYNENEVARRFGRPGAAAFIQKPYTPARLAEKIKSILGD